MDPAAYAESVAEPIVSGGGAFMLHPDTAAMLADVLAAVSG